MKRDLLFQVTDDNGVYRIYTNGDIEGFGPNAWISDFHWAHMRTAIAETKAAMAIAH